MHWHNICDNVGITIVIWWSSGRVNFNKQQPKPKSLQIALTSHKCCAGANLVRVWALFHVYTYVSILSGFKTEVITMNLGRLTDISELLPDQLQNLIDCPYMYAYSYLKFHENLSIASVLFCWQIRWGENVTSLEVIMLHERWANNGQISVWGPMHLQIKITYL